MRRIVLVLALAWAAAAIWVWIPRRKPRFARGGYVSAGSWPAVADCGCFIPLAPGLQSNVELLARLARD